MYIWSGDTYKPDGAYEQKTIIAMTKFTSKLLLMTPPPTATHFLPRSYHHRTTSAKSAAALLLAPPSWSFLEAFWVRVRANSSLFAFSRLTNSENVVGDGEETAAKIAMNALCVYTRPIFISLPFSWRHHLADFSESFRSVLRVGETVWLSPPKPERVSWRSFSTSAAISAMRACAKRNLRSAASAAGFPSFTFLTIALNCVLVKTCHSGPSWQFCEYSYAFHGSGERFHEIAMKENGWGKERKINGKPATPILVIGGE